MNMRQDRIREIQQQKQAVDERAARDAKTGRDQTGGKLEKE